MAPSSPEIAGTLCFALAVAHSFLVRPLGRLIRPLGEVELAFGLWATAFVAYLAAHSGLSNAARYLGAHSFGEPAFVFVVMAVCSSQPILDAATKLIELCARLIPARRPVAFYAACLGVGPLLGSLITEPAAMTVTALVLSQRYYARGLPRKLMYATIGLLFVNISIGGTLTPYAAPPILMVARKWGWDLGFMLSHLGWKAVVAIVLSTAAVTARFRHELARIGVGPGLARAAPAKTWQMAVHLAFLGFIAASESHPAIFGGLFLLFIGFHHWGGSERRTSLEFQKGLLVALFLASLVVLGVPQRWWLEPLLTSLSAPVLYVGSIALTAVTDNAALTYLGSQSPSLTAAGRYALVAGAVVGGGLTVIANAPNPIGYGILRPAFGNEGINPLLLFTHALGPTLVAAACFWFL